MSIDLDIPVAIEERSWTCFERAEEKALGCRRKDLAVLAALCLYL